MKWTIYVLIAVVIALVPCVLYPELITPFTVWEDWARSHNHQQVRYSGANLPPALRGIVPVFVVVVLPPTWIAERLGASKGMYSYLAESSAGVAPGGSFHYYPPALIAAGEFLRFGLPLLRSIHERALTPRRIRRQPRHRRDKLSRAVAAA